MPRSTRFSRALLPAAADQDEKILLMFLRSTEFLQGFPFRNPKKVGYSILGGYEAGVIVNDLPAVREALPDKRKHAADIVFLAFQMPTS